MNNWQVLILSGPVGSGKASVGQKLCQELPGTTYVQVYRSKTRTLSLDGDSARDQALVDVRKLLDAGQKVVIDDVIETPAELSAFFDALAGVPAVASFLTCACVNPLSSGCSSHSEVRSSSSVPTPWLCHGFSTVKAASASWLNIEPMGRSSAAPRSTPSTKKPCTTTPTSFAVAAWRAMNSSDRIR